MRIAAALFALVAVCCMIGAIAGMVSHAQSERTGWALRVAAVVCFGAAVALGAIGHH